MTALLICGGLWGLAAVLLLALPRLSRARRVLDAGDAGLDLLRDDHMAVAEAAGVTPPAPELEQDPRLTDRDRADLLARCESLWRNR